MDNNYQEKLDQSSFGGQRALVVSQFPDADVTHRTADYLRLIDLTALPAGTYYLRFNIGGLSVVYLQLKATFAGTVTTSAVSTYLLPGGALDADAFVNQAYQTFTGTGAMTSTVLQTATLAATKGEQMAILKVVIGTSAATFTQAEVNGPR